MGTMRMKNLFISNLDKKDVNHFTSKTGLFLRKKVDKPFKKLVHFFTNANIIRIENNTYLSDEEYYSCLRLDTIPRSEYPLSKKKNVNNIVLERYPQLDEGESYIFAGNHTCPEDIETMLNVIDRNAYLVLGSVESLKYNPEIYLAWLNGMIVFDTLDREARKELFAKMERVLKSNSILIFPEGTHNYHPSKLILNLFDGSVNLALKTGKRIVPVTLLRDDEHSISYMDVGNPIDIRMLFTNIYGYYPGEGYCEKYQIKTLSSYLRDKMATALYYLMVRHTDLIKRNQYKDIEKQFISAYVKDSLTKLKWRHDVFDAECLTKKNEEDRKYEEVIRTLSHLQLKKKALTQTMLSNREYVLKEMDLERKDVASNIRKAFYSPELVEEKNVSVCYSGVRSADISGRSSEYY